MAVRIGGDIKFRRFGRTTGRTTSGGATCYKDKSGIASLARRTEAMRRLTSSIQY